MAVSKEPSKYKRGAPRWLVTYADMMTLLLCFFVLLLSFANTDTTKFKEVLGSMKDAFGVQREVLELGKEGGLGLPIKMESTASKSEAEKKKLVNLLKTMVKEEGVEKNTLIIPVRNGVRLEITELAGHAMFDRGGTDLTPESQRLLRKMIPTMRETIYKITVEGHSDNTPLRSSKFPSNWELSSARAGRVVRFFIQEGKLDSRRFTAVGHSDTKPLVENTTPENRDKNRRVSILYEVF
ncbi:MAG: flagellar motor protein MotB [Candidatus Aminicenantes bacterium]|jgi:chemotaxis protein MotB